MSPRVTGRVGRGNPAGAPAAGLTAESLLYAATSGSVQDLASDKLGRELSASEIEWVAQRLTLAAGEALDTLVGSLPIAESPIVLAARLQELAEAIEALANKHTEQLDFESYAGLAEHAAELKAVARVIAADDMAAEIARMLDRAEDHLDLMRRLYEDGGAS